MSPSTRLGPALDDHLDDHLDDRPALPPARYLAAGRVALRRRRARRAGVAGAVVAAVAAAVLGAGPLLPTGPGPDGAVERDPAVATGTVEAGRSLSSLSVEQGTGDIDAFTTERIPSWATEYGNHGPAGIAPDGRLWIAPEATVLRTIDNPFGASAQEAGVSHSYAVEVRWDDPWEGTGEGLDVPPIDLDGVVWSFVFQQEGDTSTFGELDMPERWTADFGLWAEDTASGYSDRPSFPERLATFAGDRSERLDPGPGVTIVREATGVSTGDRQQYPRQTAAEVRIDGQTWFVLATGGDHGYAFYDAFDEVAAGASHLDGFLRFAAAGFVRDGSGS